LQAKEVKYPRIITVVAADYSYNGKIVSVFRKTSKAVRAVVEDDNGRLFIHNAKQLGMGEDELEEYLCGN
jgi:hypothetical protein